jgi:hypothetical protein
MTGAGHGLVPASNGVVPENNVCIPLARGVGVR